MYVLAVLEWASMKGGHSHPTQIALTRVDTVWNATDSFFSRIRPFEDTPDWWHCAFAGGHAQDLRNADPIYEVAPRMKAWLRPDDVLCW